MPNTGSPRGRYLPTGMRVVGDGAQAVLTEARYTSRPRLEPGSVEDTLYEVQFTLEPESAGRRAIETILDAVLDDVRRAWPECPRLRRDEPLEHPVSRFGGFRFQNRTMPGEGWDGHLLWRAVHPVVPGAPITTRLLVEERGGFVRVSARVTADDGVMSVGGFGAGHAQPPFFQTLRSAGMTPRWLGALVSARHVGPGMVEDLVHSTLDNPERKLTAVVLAPLEEEGYAVPPDDFAWELLGRARLWVLESHPLTYKLTDMIGDRRMSCFRGAARAYRPGWPRHDDSRLHPLLLGERVSDPVLRANWLGQLSAQHQSPLHFPDLETDRPQVDARSPGPAPAAKPTAAPKPSGSTARTHAAELPAPSDAAKAEAPSEAPAAAPPEVQQPVLRLVQADPSPALQELIETVHALHGIMSHLSDEVERLRTISAVRSSSTNAIERRLGRLEDILEAAFPDGTGAATATMAAGAAEEPEGPDDESRPSLVDVVQDVAGSYEDAIAFLDSAYASAKDSPYEDPDRVRAILEAMGGIARRRRDGVLGMSLREAFADLGIDYRSAIARTTSARLREQYRFTFGNEPIETEEHIVLGNTYDPRRCLRIYFTSRLVNDPRFVVAHVGRHFEVKSSS